MNLLEEVSRLLSYSGIQFLIPAPGSWLLASFNDLVKNYE